MKDVNYVLKKTCLFLLLIAPVMLSCSDEEQLTREDNQPESESRANLSVLEAPSFVSTAPLWNGSPSLGSTNNYFTRYWGWTGADATYSVALNNNPNATSGKRVWMFGDSFVSQVFQPDGAHPTEWREPMGFVRNTLMVQNGSSFITVVGGPKDMYGIFKPFMATGNEYVNLWTGGVGSEWYWPGDATTRNGYLYMYWFRYYKFGTGAWDYYPSCIDMVKIPLTDLTSLTAPSQSEEARQVSVPFSSMHRIYPAFGSLPQSTEIHIGAAICEVPGANGAVSYYVYIVDKINSWHKAKVMRVQCTSGQDILTGTKKYWNGGSSWINGYPTTAASIMKKSDGSELSVSAQFSVSKIGSKYRLLTQEDFGGDKIYMYESTSPVGPWSGETVLYTTPGEGGTVDTYNAFLHPEIKKGSSGNDANTYLVSYNRNSPKGDIYDNAGIYRPKFLWALVPPD